MVKCGVSLIGLIQFFIPPQMSLSQRGKRKEVTKMATGKTGWDHLGYSYSIIEDLARKYKNIPEI